VFGPPLTHVLDLPFHGLAIAVGWWLIAKSRAGRIGTLAAVGTFAVLMVLSAAFWSRGSLFHLARNGALLLFVELPVFAAIAARFSAPAGRRAALLAGSAALVAIGVYAMAIEPRWLEVTRYRLAAPGLSRPVRVLVMADIQTDRVGAYERRVFEAAARTDPDLVVLPGDYLQADGDTRERLAPALRRLLAALDPALGLYAVRGNVEPDDWTRLFEGVPSTVTFDRTGTRMVRPDLALTGLSLRDSFSAAHAVDPVPGSFHIAFGHAPDFALGDIPADLLIAGHTHGGQVRLPGRGPVITLSRVPRAWASGLTVLGGRTLVVSRGIGVERGIAPRIRFLCRPELVVIDLVPGDAAPAPDAIVATEGGLR
jgi:predicted MPP superfamily phosphohydrolase